MYGRAARAPIRFVVSTFADFIRKNAELSDKLTELLRKSNEAVSEMSVQVSELTRLLKAEREESAKLRSEIKV